MILITVFRWGVSCIYRTDTPMLPTPQNIPDSPSTQTRPTLTSHSMTRTHVTLWSKLQFFFLSSTLLINFYQAIPFDAHVYALLISLFVFFDALMSIFNCPWCALLDTSMSASLIPHSRSQCIFLHPHSTCSSGNN